jgi:hypothetical protein
MPFELINSSEIEVGDPVTAALLSKVKNSLDNLNTRTTAIESAARKVEVFEAVIYNATKFSPLNGLLFYQASFDFTLTNAVIGIWEAGVLTGFLEVDVKKNTSRNPAGFTTVFTAEPIIDFSTAVDYQDSAQGTFDNAAKNIVAGDWLRLDITQAPTNGPIPMFAVIIFGEV